MSMEVTTRQSLGQMARADWDAKQIATIRATVASGANDAELAMFLEICARYELDPFAKQVFFTKFPGRNGAEGRSAIVVGRDGMQVIASRNRSFRGVLSGVVREKDEFSVGLGEEGVDLGGGHRLVHVQRGHHKARGAIVGAWAVAYRDGREPRYFYAPIEEYQPKNGPPQSPWVKGQVSVMIEKVAISTVLRLQFEITGLYDEAEVDAIAGDSPQLLGRGDAGSGDIAWPEDDWVATRLACLFAAAEQTVPGSWLPSKIRMTLAGKTEGEKEQLCDTLEQFIRAHGGSVPEAVEVVEMADVEVEVNEAPQVEPEAPEGGDEGDGDGGDEPDAA